MRRAWLAAGWICAAAIAALAALLPPDGRSRADGAQFVGRFHPLLVHLPIALILLVPLLEWLGRAEPRNHLRAAAGLVLDLATAAALAAAADGWLLAWSGGYQGPVVLRHLWGGVAFAGLCVITATLRGRGPAAPGRSGRGTAREVERHVLDALSEAAHKADAWEAAPGPWRSGAYAASLVFTLAAMVWASHNGGSLSHGGTFLTQEMPAPLRRLLHLAPAARPRDDSPRTAALSAPGKKARIAAPPATLYAAKIQPIFDHSCVSCHGPTKVKGGLRLDSYAELMMGGDSGDEVEPWEPADSELLRRINLPPDDDDFMPNNGRNLLSPAQKELIARWIAAGASDRQPAN